MAETIEKLRQEYRDGIISRREFIQRAVVLTGSLAAATSLIDLLLSSPAPAAQVNPNDPALTSLDVKFAAPDGVPISGYLSRPKGEDRRPAVVVIHEWSGINDHVRDVARRLATAGYVALAPDLLSRQGGTGSFPSPEAATETLLKVDEQVITTDLTAAVNYLKGQNLSAPTRSVLPGSVGEAVGL